MTSYSLIRVVVGFGADNFGALGGGVSDRKNVIEGGGKTCFSDFLLILFDVDKTE